MPSCIQVLSLQTHPILALAVSRPDAAARALTAPGQTALTAFHITLARLDDLNIELGALPDLPTPPTSLTLTEEVRFIDSGAKQSCYIALADADQDLLRAFVRQVEAHAGVTLLDPCRVFHVTVSNAGDGEVRASVGAVWDFPSQAL